MDVSGASNLQEKEKTEKDVKTEHGVGGGKAKQIRSKLGRRKISMALFPLSKMSSMKTSKRSTAARAHRCL